MELNPSTLATGGLVAAVVGFWNQIKNTLHYVSSFVVIQADVEYNIARQVLPYLKAHYKKVPSGIYTFTSIMAMLKTSKWVFVPFRSLNKTTIFYLKKQVIVATVSNEGLKLVSLRGMVNFEALINNAMDFEESRTQTDSSPNRFTIFKVIGSEKGIWGENQRASRVDSLAGSETSESSPTPMNGSSGSLLCPDFSMDVSFRYQKEEYQFTKEDNPFKALFYPPEVHDHMQDARTWMASEDWYAKRSIPWKRGWLIHGPGGTGKSSLATALAKTLRIPIYQYMLATLSDQEFIRRWESMQTPCIALFEDFDTVFDKREPLTEHKSLTFDCILNVISGVSALNGVFLIVTTNHIDKIDEALGVTSDKGSISTRPGRIDQVIYLGYTTEDVRRRMVQHILPDWPDVHENLVNKGEGTTPVQFQEMCLQVAFSKLNSGSEPLRLVA